MPPRSRTAGSIARARARRMAQQMQYGVGEWYNPASYAPVRLVGRALRGLAYSPIAIGSYIGSGLKSFASDWGRRQKVVQEYNQDVKFAECQAQAKLQDTNSKRKAALRACKKLESSGGAAPTQTKKQQQRQRRGAPKTTFAQYVPTPYSPPAPPAFQSQGNYPSLYYSSF